MKKQRQHNVLGNPIAALFLLLFWGFGFYQLFSLFAFIPGIISLIRGASYQEMMNNVVGYSSYFSIAGGIAALIIHRWWFSPEFKGCISRTFFKGRDMVIAVAVICAVTFGLDIVSDITNELEFSITAVALALSAGICEEMCVRVLPISVMMRDWKGEKHIVFTAVSTSVLFGLLHMINALLGADFWLTIVQVIMAAGIGIFFAALYIRTGNILLCMIIHSMHDFLVFLVKGSYDAGGIMTGELTTGVAVESLGIGIIYAGFGLWLLRRSARGDVADIWRERWKMDETAVSEAETVTE